mmetsp:Transcript_90003/g.145632  ORF Transcript_90003/g.145632 Transcript_90003/m.145632 type:complete len:89 (-) Transcript_90003:47-313(-)
MRSTFLNFVEANLSACRVHSTFASLAALRFQGVHEHAPIQFDGGDVHAGTLRGARRSGSPNTQYRALRYLFNSNFLGGLTNHTHTSNK